MLSHCHARVLHEHIILLYHFSKKKSLKDLQNSRLKYFEYIAISESSGVLSQAMNTLFPGIVKL